MSQPVLLRSEGAIAWATLNRPEVLNAINPEMLEALLALVHKIAGDDTIRVLILTGNGRAFSAGADIKAMHTMDESSFAKFIEHFRQLSQSLHTLGKPVIAAVNGYALAGGFELALMCDVRIAALSASFGLPDTPLGLPPTSGMTWLLPRVVGLGCAMHLVLSGDPIDAREAERIGLVTEIVEDAALFGIVEKLARRLASFPEMAVRLSKQGLYAACDSDFPASLALEIQNELACFRTEETRQQIAAFVKSRTKK